MGGAFSAHGEMRNTVRKRFCLGSVKGKDHYEDLGVDGRIILKSILGK
jgi:hypothetical protein